LNSQKTNEYSKQLKVKACVVSLHSGEFKGYYGMVAGITADTVKNSFVRLRWYKNNMYKPTKAMQIRRLYNGSWVGCEFVQVSSGKI
tara:strand:- start:161 stop:421 length:261 start_codon:yes stop_codon:yes gene_type:complete